MIVCGPPAERRSDLPSHKFDRPQDPGMRRIYRMHLNSEIGDPCQCSVSTQRGDDLLRCADMHVERFDKIGEFIAGHTMTSVDETPDGGAQT